MSTGKITLANPGAFVISLDFELYWGVRDFLKAKGEYHKNIAGERPAVHALLDLFEEYEIAGTWAIVGILFAESKAELDKFKPSVLPKYENKDLFPYNEDFSVKTGRHSIQFAPDLVELIKQTPRQEIATHTFSHYYCLENGQSKAEFASDIDAAKAIAEKKGVNLRSIVFPRNQHNPDYDEVLLKNGISCYRGNQRSRMYQFDSETLSNPFFRMTRLADTYFNVSGLNLTRWEGVWDGGIADVPASIFLRAVSKPYGALENLQFRRIAQCLEQAAKNNEIFHLWWHPHNFGVNLEQNIAFLRRILDRFNELRAERGMLSLTMAEVAETAKGAEVLGV